MNNGTSSEMLKFKKSLTSRISSFGVSLISTNKEETCYELKPLNWQKTIIEEKIRKRD